MQTNCPICNASAQSTIVPPPNGEDGTLYNCPECGKFLITRTALAIPKLMTVMSNKTTIENFRQAIALHDEKKTGDVFCFDTGNIEDIAKG